MSLTNATFVSCNFPSLPLKNPTLRNSLLQPQNSNPRIPLSRKSSKVSIFSATQFCKTSIFTSQNEKCRLQICQSTLNDQKPEDPVLSEGENGDAGKNWTTSILLFVLWGALMFYVLTLSPNQTPSRDMYFLKKLLNLKGDDGFRMNEVLVSVWYIMGLWPLVYSMLMLPTARR
ncbi:hypothetical protein C1H46_038540 [Malus baccata]|uniref:Transmembrane protein n=1 Tax=Malus baccata TaxID=106549 RepID=A0A540KP30_MALBA|nr:hypothetical protein C1H46_038540 [Malus baccata]